MPADPVAKPAWLIQLATCESTNTWALEHFAALAHGACIWTEQQTAGRGRGTNRWLSPPGVLTASFVLGLPEHVPAAQLSLCVGLAVAHAVEDHAPAARVQVKWPNDCYLMGRKLAGILCERPAPGGGASGVVVGIGLNLDPRWEQSPATLPFATAATQSPASMAEVCAPPPPMVMLTALRRYLLEATGLLAAGGWAQLVPHLQVRDWLAGKSLTVESAGERLAGTGDGIDDHGRLVVRSEAGHTRALSSATVLSVG
jgi:BirA family biotin operon repressor/biotin-[acetyl-CoA-carboxylase] ligase